MGTTVVKATLHHVPTGEQFRIAEARHNGLGALRVLTPDVCPGVRREVAVPAGDLNDLLDALGLSQVTISEGVAGRMSRYPVILHGSRDTYEGTPNTEGLAERITATLGEVGDLSSKQASAMAMMLRPGVKRVNEFLDRADDLLHDPSLV